MNRIPIYTLLFVAVIAMTLSGCIAPQTLSAIRVEAKSPTVSELIEPQLNAGVVLVEIEAVDYPLPEDVDKGQIGATYQLGTLTFATVLHHSMNVLLALPKGHTHSFTGVLISVDGASWQKYLEIKDVVSTDKNNPYALWTEQGELYLAIVDQNGAGSGEGMMKVEKLTDDGGWELTGCYYFGQNYRGPELDGEYLAFSKQLEKQTSQPLEACQKVELIILKE